jgi:hypothetical protein
MLHSSRCYQKYRSNRKFQKNRYFLKTHWHRWHRLIQKLHCTQPRLLHLIQKLHLIHCFRSIPMLLNVLSHQ